MRPAAGVHSVIQQDARRTHRQSWGRKQMCRRKPGEGQCLRGRGRVKSQGMCACCSTDQTCWQWDGESAETTSTATPFLQQSAGGPCVQQPATVAGALDLHAACCSCHSAPVLQCWRLLVYPRHTIRRSELQQSPLQSKQSLNGSQRLGSDVPSDAVSGLLLGHLRILVAGSLRGPPGAQKPRGATTHVSKAGPVVP